MFSRGLMESFKQDAAFGGEAVFLQAAVGVVGNGALDEVKTEAGKILINWSCLTYNQTVVVKNIK